MPTVQVEIHFYFFARVKRFFSLFLMILTALPLLAQGVRLEGRVVDDNGEPLEMAHVRLSRGGIGTLTNFKGEYSLNLPESDSLTVIFTSIGFKRVEKTLNTRNVAEASDGKRKIVLNIQMRTNQAYINDVEVVSHQQNQFL